MAYSVVDTHIQNPARAGKGKKRMAKTRRKMSAKQIKHFGTKRQKAALKARRHAPARKRNPPKGGGRVISGYGSTVMNPRRRKRNPGGSHKIVINGARKRKNSSHRRRTKRNPELVSFLLGNPAKRSSKGMARSRRKTKRAASHRSNAGTRRRRVIKHVAHRRRSVRNPGGMPLKDFMWGGIGGLAGFVGSAAIPQLLMSSSNTGVTGYAMTAAATIGLTILAHMFVKNKAVTFGVGIGGAMNLLRRVITDQTPFGSYLSSSGMGDYMVANWGPPRMQNGLHSAMAESPGTPWSGAAIGTSSGIGLQDMSDIRSGRPC
jgi:hypothetical protein